MSTTPPEQTTSPEQTTTPQAPAAGPVPTPPVARPDGMDEAEWSALGDPGKRALVRERARANTAEQQLVEARRAAATTTPQQPPEPPKHATPTPDQAPDFAALIGEAVRQAVAPLQEAAKQREAAEAATAVKTAVMAAAGDHFHDPTDALTGIDLASVVDTEGHADAAKVATALNDLLTRKPHLGKAVDRRRQTPAGDLVGAGGGPGTPPLTDRVKAQLDLMKDQH